MNFKSYLAGTLFFILLIWGPLYDEYKFGIIVRLSYLIFLPISVLKILNYVNLSKRTEIILNRALSHFISLTFFAIAYFESKELSHLVNDNIILNRDGYEEVGNDIEIPGPDWRNVILWIAFGLIFLWIAINPKKDDK
jgi:hypothetical protein